MSKLTDQDIKDIQTLYAIGYAKQSIAREFGVKNSAISYHTRQIAPPTDISLRKIAHIIQMHDPRETDKLTKLLQTRETYIALLAA